MSHPIPHTDPRATSFLQGPGFPFRRIAVNEQRGEHVVGTYMYPMRRFGLLIQLSSDETRVRPPFEIDHNFEVFAIYPTDEDTSVLLTRCGGLFVQGPVQLDWPTEKADFATASRHINLVIAEFALAGQVSAPAGPIDLALGRLLENHAAVTSWLQARETYVDRTIGPFFVIESEIRDHWPAVDQAIALSLIDLRRARRLAQVSATTPALVASAYSTFSRTMFAEATVLAFVVIEQLLQLRWDAYVGGAEGRKTKLRDESTYTTAIKAEILLAAGMLEKSLFDLVSLARGHRNKTAHREAAASRDGARASCSALKAMLEDYLGEDVAPAQAAEWA